MSEVEADDQITWANQANASKPAFFFINDQKSSQIGRFTGEM
jgi:hypothetical protein